MLWCVLVICLSSSCAVRLIKLEAQWAVPVSLTSQSVLRKLYTKPFHRCFLPNFCSFGYSVSEKIFFGNQPIKNKNCLWWPCLLMDRDEMNNIYRGPSIDASYYVSVHLAKRFQRRRFFRNWPIRNKNRLWWPCLLTDRDEMSILYREPSIDASY